MKTGKEFVDRLFKGKMNDEEILRFREEVREYLKSDAPEEEKKEIIGYMETVEMACAMIENNVN